MNGSGAIGDRNFFQGRAALECCITGGEALGYGTTELFLCIGVPRYTRARDIVGVYAAPCGTAVQSTPRTVAVAAGM